MSSLSHKDMPRPYHHTHNEAPLGSRHSQNLSTPVVVKDKIPFSLNLTLSLPKNAWNFYYFPAETGKQRLGMGQDR